MNTAPLLSGLGLEPHFGDILYQSACDSSQEILLNYFASSHTFTENQKLALVLVLNIFWQKYNAKIIDSAFDFSFAVFKIKQFVDILHLCYWLFGIADDDHLVVLGREYPFDCGNLVKLCDFFFYINHI